VEWIESEFYRILSSVVTQGKGSKGKTAKGHVEVTSKHLQQVFAEVDTQLLKHLQGKLMLGPLIELGPVDSRCIAGRARLVHAHRIARKHASACP
jgi:hypothetical protein